jgi:hypothetical protein
VGRIPHWEDMFLLQPSQCLVLTKTSNHGRQEQNSRSQAEGPKPEVEARGSDGTAVEVCKLPGDSLILFSLAVGYIHSVWHSLRRPPAGCARR